LKNKTFFLYPNPALDKVFINTTEEINYELKSLQGILLSKGSIGFKEHIDILNLQPGFYLLVIEFDGVEYVEKFMKI